MRKVSEFKKSVKTQNHRLVQLEERLARLRENFRNCTDNVSRRNDLEVEGKSVKAEIQNITDYLGRCNYVLMHWGEVNDQEVNQLADFRFWRRSP